ncbi:MAG: aldehyde dehydrogenase family protein [Motiliproteus sp.]
MSHHQSAASAASIVQQIDGLSDEVQGLLSQVLPPSVRVVNKRDQGREVRPLVDPTTAQIFARVAQASLEDADLAVAAALDVLQGEWGAYSSGERESLLYRFAELFDTYQHPLAELESLATGRAISAILHNVIPEAQSWVRYLAGLPSKLDGHTGADQGAMDPFRCSFREPGGVAVLRLHCTESLTRRLIPVVSALSAGCSVIVLCDDATYPVFYYLCDLLARAGVPEDAISLLSADAAVEERLLSHDDVFQPQLGDGSNLSRSSRMLVFEDADIDQVVETLIKRVLSPLNPSVFTPRIHVHETIYEELIEAIEGALRQLKCGPALDSQTQLGPLCLANLQQQAQEIVQRSRNLGLRVVCGGDVGEIGNAMTPTLIADDQLHLAHLPLSLPMPVLMVQPFGYEDRTVRRANRDRYCQGVSLFTQQLARIRRLSRGLRTEQIWVNSHYRMEPGDQYDPLGPYLRRRLLWIES